jgi:hypothetical protein
VSVIPIHTPLWDLLGLVSKNKYDYGTYSTFVYQGEGQEGFRLMAGPIRFVNHSHNPNVMVSTILF